MSHIMQQYQIYIHILYISNYNNCEINTISFCIVHSPSLVGSLFSIPLSTNKKKPANNKTNEWFTFVFRPFLLPFIPHSTKSNSKIAPVLNGETMNLSRSVTHPTSIWFVSGYPGGIRKSTPLLFCFDVDDDKDNAVVGVITVDCLRPDGVSVADSPVKCYIVK